MQLNILYLHFPEGEGRGQLFLYIWINKQLFLFLTDGASLNKISLYDIIIGFPRLCRQKKTVEKI